MTSSKLITIFGATGTQGRSVIESLLRNKSQGFSIRGITRNLESETSKALVAKGVEMVNADGQDSEQVAAALQGSWGMFLNLNSEDPAIIQNDGLSESDIGKKIIDAAADADVQYVVYSGAASPSKITNGEAPFIGFDEKYAIGEYARGRGFKGVTIVGAGWYLENHITDDLSPALGNFPFSVDEEGYRTFRTPYWGGNGEIPFVSISEDFGDIVHGVLLAPEKYRGQFVQGISAIATPDELVMAFQEVTGKKSRHISMGSWSSMEVGEVLFLEATRDVFRYCQVSGGKYFGEANNDSLAKDLKAKAVEAKGMSQEGNGLVSLRTFFSKHF